MFVYWWLFLILVKCTPEILKLSTAFYVLSVSHNRFSMTEMRQFGASRTEGLRNHLISKSVRRSCVNLYFKSMEFDESVLEAVDFQSLHQAPDNTEIMS